MLRERVIFACLNAFIIMLLLPSATCLVNQNYDCHPSSCGNIQNISYPFRLKGDPHHCGTRKYDLSYFLGKLKYELSCENNRTVLKIDSRRYYVEEINYNDNTMRLVDPGLQKDNCSSLPLYSLTNDFISTDPYILQGGGMNAPIAFISCAKPVNSSFYIDTSACISGNTSFKSSSSSLLLQRHTYVVDGDMPLSDLEESCSIDLTAWASYDYSIFWWGHVPEKFNVSFHSIHDSLVYGFDLWWGYYYFTEQIQYYSSCSIEDYVIWCHSGCLSEIWRLDVKDSFHCIWNLLGNIEIYIYGGVLILIFVVAARILCVSPCVFAFLVYKWRRRHLSMYDNIEEFIQSYNKLTPVRYSYSDIRKITKGFKDKLGEGGFGSVFKGKLRSGHLVAVKILGNSKANGQDFINEVATIGRIHHVNVARLIGFCAERSKRALVYDFMPNGSLEKYIFPREGIIFLSFEKLYAISLGIARGIEYLHGGCDMQILHFDIKPHNILLDEKFTPKVSDFGLAKLYPTDDSIVNLTAARGTMGYMAPELFYKNIGGVSYKADVYSFGMLLMEMGSKRRNLNPFVEHLSQIYFPSWVYDQFNDGKDIEMGDVTEEERKIAKKMIIVAFWCIQLKPTDRPSMSKVVEMLEGNVELQMPPKPFLSPQEIPVADHGININPTELIVSAGDSTDSISLIANAI